MSNASTFFQSFDIVSWVTRNRFGIGLCFLSSIGECFVFMQKPCRWMVCGVCGIRFVNQRSPVQFKAILLSCNNLRQVVHTLVPVSPGSIINTGQGAVTPYHWEGNRRSGFSLAMHHRLQWFIHLWAHGLRKGDKHPAYTPLRVMVHFTFTFSVFCCIICYVAVVGSSSDVSGFGLDGSSVDKSRNSFRFVRVVLFVPSVLWRCLLGCRKGIQPVKNWVVGCWHGYLSGAKCRLAYGPADATATHCLVLQ